MPRSQYSGTTPPWTHAGPRADFPSVIYASEALIPLTWTSYLGVDGLGQGHFDIVSQTAARNRTGIRVFLKDVDGFSGADGNGYQIATSIDSANKISIKGPAFTIPEVVTNIGGDPGDEYAYLYWTIGDDSGVILRYQYQYKEGSGAYGAWTDWDEDTHDPRFPFLIVDGLDNGTAYTFKVRPVNEAGNGPESDEVVVTPAEGATTLYGNPLNYEGVDPLPQTPLAKEINIFHTVAGTLANIKALVDSNANLEGRYINNPTVSDLIRDRVFTLDNAHEPGEAYFRINANTSDYLYATSPEAPQTNWSANANFEDVVRRGRNDIEGKMRRGDRLWLQSAHASNVRRGSIEIWKYGY